MTEEQIALATMWVRKLKKAWFIVFNITFVLLNIVYASFVFYYNTQTITWVPYVLLVFASIYVVAFVMILCLKNKNTKRIAVKNYRASVKIFKNLLSLLTLLISIITIVNTAKYDYTSFSFALTVVSTVTVVAKVVISIITIIRITLSRRVKEQRRVLKKEMFSDIKAIVLLVEQKDKQEISMLEQKYENNEVATKDDLYSMRPIEQIKTLLSLMVISLSNNAGRIALRIAEYRKDSKLITKSTPNSDNQK